MDELTSQITQLTNRITQLELQLNSGVFSNTILQSKNLIQASGAMTSPNFVTDSAGWSLDHLGNLEANDGKFRGGITASTITGSTITGGTIQTSATGHRVVMEGSTDDITFFNSNGDETIILDGAGTSAAYSQMSVGGGIYLSNDVVADYQYGTEVYSGSGAGTAFVIHPIGNGEDEYFFFNSNGTMVTDAEITAGELHADNGESRTIGLLGADGVTKCYLEFEDGILVDYAES